jgi:hypothetical protein
MRSLLMPILARVDHTSFTPETTLCDLRSGRLTNGSIGDRRQDLSLAKDSSRRDPLGKGTHGSALSADSGKGEVMTDVTDID